MLEISGYESPRALQKALKKDPKAVETLPWQCKSMEPRDGLSVIQRHINGEEFIRTYPGEDSAKGQPQTQMMEATNSPSMAGR